MLARLIREEVDDDLALDREGTHSKEPDVDAVKSNTISMVSNLPPQIPTPTPTPATNANAASAQPHADNTLHPQPAAAPVHHTHPAENQSLRVPGPVPPLHDISNTYSRTLSPYPYAPNAGNAQGLRAKVVK